MKNVSQSFKDNIKKYGRQLDSKITIGNLIIGKQDINSINPSFHTSLFKTVMKSFEIDCNLFIPKDEIINISIGVKFGNSGYEYIEYENFKVKSCEKQEDTESFKIIAYDKIIESMIDYDLELTQAISLREYIIKIFERLSWSTEGIPATFINSTKQINPSVHIGIGYTFRDVLDEIATITGSFIYIKNNVPTLGYITETNETINEEYLSQDDVTIGEKYLINSLVFSRAEESDNIFREDDNSIEKNGLYEFRIEDNQIISTNDRDVYIDELFNYLKTLEFYIYDVKSTGIMWLDICDKFTFDIHGSTYSTIILNDEITVDQDIEEMLYVERPEETETDYKCADTTDKRINQAYILVNKQKQEITQRVNSVEQEFNKSIENLQSQIDGSIQFWNGSDIPTVSNYPAKDWTTEEEKNKHRADIYTVIEDVDGELKQGKSYRFDKVGNTWQWIELTDNELSAVQALAQSKAKVFVTTPKVPYSIGDLWLNNGKLYECQVSKDASGSYSASDWKEAVNYTDDTVANLAKTLANNAQSTADSAVEGVANITNTTGEAEGKNIYINDSAEEPLVDISLHGESNQKTRSGKNLFDKTKFKSIAFATYSYADGIYTITPTGEGNARLDIYINLPAGTYTYSGNGSNATQIRNSNDVTIANSVSSSNTTFTITEEGTHIRFNWGTGTSTEEFILDTNNIQIEKGSTVTEYEPYGAMPSPDCPSEIENVEGKNLFNKSVGFIHAFINSSGNIIADNSNTNVLFDGYTSVKGNRNYIFSSNEILYKVGISEFRRDKTFIKRTEQSSIKHLTITTDVDTRFLRIVIIYQNGSETTQKVVNSLDLQLEEGTVATPYAPYNSLEVKVEGKNRFDISSVEYSTYYDNEGKHTNYTNSFGKVIKAKEGDWILKIKNNYTSSVRGYIFGYNEDMGYVKAYYWGGKIDVGNRIIVNISKEQNIKYWTVSILDINPNETDLSSVIEIQLEPGTITTDYEPYKSQTAYFPLAEGQKLMEGSYLADDGVHNVRGQIILDGTESGYDVYGTNSGLKLSNSTLIKGKTYNGTDVPEILCNCFMKQARTAIFTGAVDNSISINNNEIFFRLTNIAKTVAELKTYLAEQYANGTPVIAEYELAEEEIVPYTEEQQEAWNKNKALITYKNITNINSEAYAKVVYMRDNGLDVYETKQNANKRYTETTEKFAETKITTDSIKDTVSTTQTTVANNYQELKGKFDDYAPKSDIITIQNSVEKIQTDTYTKTEINTKLIDGSVEKVSTTAGTFDDNGLTIEKTNAKTKGNFNEKGITVTDATSGSSQELLFAGYDEELNETIVRSKNMTVEKYFVESNVARREEYSNPVLGGKGIGVFML